MKRYLLMVWAQFRDWVGLLLPSIKRGFVNWNELLTVPIGLALWYYSPYLLHRMDPTAATFDAGIFQVFLFAIIGTLIFSGINWFIIKVSFPRVYNYIDNELETDLWDGKSSADARLLFAFAFYFGHFLMMVLLAMAIPAV